jgi:large subunit ribosomal protein L13
MASQVAHLINGKHKATFAPHLNCGDKVVVINASKVRFTGKKASIKIYAKHTGYPGGFRTTTPKELLAKKPHAIVENAVRGMLPKNKLGRQKFKNLFVYPYSTHPHNAQKPEKITFPHS